MKNGSLTLQAIARLAGTTKSTVSRVLSDSPRISDETKARVNAVVRERGFQPNFLARALARGRTGTLGVLASNISSGFFAEVMRGMDIAAGRNRGHLLVSIAHGDEDYFSLFDDLLTNGQVDGLVAIDPPMAIFGRDLAPGHRPLVLCAARPPDRARTWDTVDSVTVDNARGMSRLVAYLAGRGARDIVHLAGPRNNFDARQRRAAFMSAARRLRIPKWRVLDGHLIREDGRDAIRKYFAAEGRRPGAFVAFNDSVALGVLAEIRNGARRRIAVTGWDNTPAAEALDLTSVEMPLTGWGGMSARLLLDRMEHEAAAKAPGRHVILDLELKLRKSSRLSAGRKGGIR